MFVHESANVRVLQFLASTIRRVNVGVKTIRSYFILLRFGNTRFQGQNMGWVLGHFGGSCWHGGLRRVRENLFAQDLSGQW